MFDFNGQRTQLKEGDVISFKQAPSTGTLIAVSRFSEAGKKQEIYFEDGVSLFSLRFFPFEQCGELAAFVADACGLTVVGGRTAERGDLNTAEFKVSARE